jgi:hypothetical protein
LWHCPLPSEHHDHTRKCRTWHPTIGTHQVGDLALEQVLSGLQAAVALAELHAPRATDDRAALESLPVGFNTFIYSQINQYYTYRIICQQNARVHFVNDAISIRAYLVDDHGHIVPLHLLDEVAACHEAFIALRQRFVGREQQLKLVAH